MENLSIYFFCFSDILEHDGIEKKRGRIGNDTLFIYAGLFEKSALYGSGNLGGHFST